jgi:HEAT repeat protein
MGTTATAAEDQRSRHEAEIIAALQTDDLSIKQRRKLVSDLRTVSSDRSLAVFKEHLASADDQLAVRALLGLEHLGTDAATDAIIDSLWMDRGPRFTFAVRALRRGGVRRAVPALVDCLERRHDELNRSDRRIVVLGFAEMPHRSEVPVLERMLRECGGGLRHAAALALSRIRTPESLAALEAAADEFSWFRGRAIRRALRERRRLDEPG